ncbi:MAG: branched-chain amino acid ABC transporter permease [Holophaga sp.]|jgi:branched-chain amino acid transport system permease protein
MLLQTLVTGLAIGGIYALMAVGYSLVFSIMGFSNWAYGTIIMYGAYVGYYSMTKFGLPFWLALVLSMVGAAILCVANERIAYNPLRKRKAPSLYLMISAMGTAIFLENMVYVLIGAHYFSMPEVFQSQVLEFGGVTLGVMDIFAIVFSFTAIWALNYFINHTKLGVGIRAVSYDSTVAQINGVNLSRTIGLVFVLSGVLAGISGTFFGMKYMVYPTMGNITNKAFIAAVIGGLGSLPGAVVGGVILGILESLVSVYISSTYRDVFSFSFLIVLLLFLPLGLMGKRLEEKV